MKLLTFGGLSVQGAVYRREKPLLLLAYLCLEGPQPRRRLASLFWPEAANPMNSLAQNLIRLRPLAGVIREEGARVAADLEADAQMFRAHARAGRWEEALALYTGAFLGELGVALNPDLEEWILDTREALGAEARAAHLSWAEHCVALGQGAQATEHAEQAHQTPGAPPCAPEDLPRLWACVGDPAHPLGVRLRREADELGLALQPLATRPAPPVLLGRAAELAALNALAPGELAWLSGPPGMGKTALLQALASRGWRVLPARAGLPLATLDPLSPRPLGSVAEALNLLRDPRLKVAIDDWEDTDDATRAALTLAARQRPGAALIVAARQPPAVLTPHHVPLYPLSAAELQGQPGAHVATGGHPALLQAFLRGQPPERTLDARLTLLGPDARRLFLALAAQGTPDLKATRAALALGAAALAQTLDLLVREGLAAPDGTLRASSPARQLLATAPLDTALVHLRLARASAVQSAWPHWQQARELWEESDQAACAQAAHWYASQELGRGYPGRAAQTLEAAPQTPEVRLLRGWALVRSGQVNDAWTQIQSLCAGQAEHLALSAVVLERLGRWDEAARCAQAVGPETGPAAGYAHYILGSIDLRSSRPAEAEQHLRRAVALGTLCGDQGLWARAGSLLALLRTRHEPPQQAFAELLSHPGLNPLDRAGILVNYATCLGESTDWPEADAVFAQAEVCFCEVGSLDGQAHTVNAQAVMLHRRGALAEAEPLYRRALALVSGSGHVQLFANIASNLAELAGQVQDHAAILSLLSDYGLHEQVQRIRSNVLAQS
ncbi:hypothetical protein [Deinococcus arcticus]|uniref:hypothetical protein n=1 Tax=Deinococcus arcticus TaxID=2136176 RepID=UPI0011B1EC77|nr:hypothetical protein [Deinococcus arcticus]